MPYGVKIPAAVLMAVVLGLALTGGVLAAKGAISSASIPDKDGIINACYATHKNVGEKQGKLRLVSDGAKCKKNEQHISWNISGGSGGLKGDTGDTGPEGPAGPGVTPTPASVVVLRGSVQGITNETSGAGGHLTEILFQVVLLSGEEAVDLTPGTTKIKYEDPSQSLISTTLSRFQASPVQGVSGSPTDSDLFLEPGEIFEIRLKDLENFLSPDLGEGTTFSVDVISEFGLVLEFEAKTPDSFPGAIEVIDLPAP